MSFNTTSAQQSPFRLPLPSSSPSSSSAASAQVPSVHDSPFLLRHRLGSPQSMTTANPGASSGMDDYEAHSSVATSDSPLPSEGLAHETLRASGIPASSFPTSRQHYQQQQQQQPSQSQPSQSSPFWNPILRLKRPHRSSSLNQMYTSNAPESPPISPSQSLLSSAYPAEHKPPVPTSSSSSSSTSPRLSFSSRSAAPNWPLARARSSDSVTPPINSSQVSPFLGPLDPASKPLDDDVHSADDYYAGDSDACAYDSDDLMSISSRRQSIVTVSGLPPAASGILTTKESAEKLPISAASSSSSPTNSPGPFRSFLASFNKISTRGVATATKLSKPSPSGPSSDPAAAAAAAGRVAIRQVVVNRNALKPKAKSFLRISRELWDELYPLDHEMKQEARLTLALRDDSLDEPSYFSSVHGLASRIDSPPTHSPPIAPSASSPSSTVSTPKNMSSISSPNSSFTTLKDQYAKSSHHHVSLHRASNDSIQTTSSSSSSSSQHHNDKNKGHKHKLWPLSSFSKHSSSDSARKLAPFLHPSSSSTTHSASQDHDNSRRSSAKSAADPRIPAARVHDSGTQSGAALFVSLQSPELSDDDYDDDDNISHKIHTNLKKLTAGSSQGSPALKSKRKASSIFDESSTASFEHTLLKRRAVSPSSSPTLSPSLFSSR